MNKDFTKVVQTLKPIMESVLQVAVYKSFSPRCVIILENEPENLLESLSALRDYAAKRHLPFPLLISVDFVNNSLDSYPLEFLDIVSSRYENLFAKQDVLQNLQFSKSDLRLQMEREVKSKWLLTRLNVLEQNPKPKLLAETLRLSIRSVTPVLKGLCYLKDRPIPSTFLDIIDQAGDVSGVNLKVLYDWVGLEKAELSTIKRYLNVLKSLMEYLEDLDK